MWLDKCGCSSFKKLRGARGPPEERGEQGIQGPPGKKGLRGERGEVGNRFNKTSNGDFDMERTLLINIGKPVDLSDAATLFTVSDAVLKAENALWREIASMKEYIDAENVKIYDKLARLKTYLQNYYLDKTEPKN